MSTQRFTVAKTDSDGLIQENGIAQHNSENDGNANGRKNNDHLSEARNFIKEKGNNYTVFSYT